MPKIEPLVVSIWCGESKPNNISAFLERFINELKTIIRRGFSIGDHRVKVIIGAFICDSPARSLLKGNTIMKCEVENQRLK